MTTQLCRSGIQGLGLSLETMQITVQAWTEKKYCAFGGLKELG